jgi:hypothetical protein
LERQIININRQMRNFVLAVNGHSRALIPISRIKDRGMFHVGWKSGKLRESGKAQELRRHHVNTNQKWMLQFFP